MNEGIIHGNLNEVKKKIINEYIQCDNSICDFFSTTCCPDLTIEENVQLYAQLREECDGDIAVNIIDKQYAIRLTDNETITLEELLNELYD